MIENNTLWMKLDELWRKEEYEEFLRLLPPLGPASTTYEIQARAKVLFWLAQESNKNLKELILVWQSAVYLFGSSDEDLLNQLDALPLEDGLRKWLLFEREILRQVYEKTSEALAPCLANITARNQKIFDALVAAQASPDLASYYTAYGRALVLARAGLCTESLAALPKTLVNPKDKPYESLVYFWCGLAKMQKGDRRGIKLFSQLGPWLSAQVEYKAELIALAYGELTHQVVEILGDAMEMLARQIKDIDFLHATAHLLITNAKNIFAHERAKDTVALHYAERALKLHPSNESIIGLRNEIRNHIACNEIQTSLANGKFSQAARVTNLYEGEDIKSFFFHIINENFEHMERILPNNRLALTLSKLILAASKVETEHPVVKRMQTRLQYCRGSYE